MRINLLVVAIAGTFLLAGAGCSSPAVIQKNIGNYTYSGKTNSGIDTTGGVSFKTEATQYTSKSGEVEAGVYTGATPADVSQAIKFYLKDEAGDQQGFNSLVEGKGNLYFRRDTAQNHICFFLWPSDNSMILMRGISCDTKDALLRAYINKYPPSIL